MKANSTPSLPNYRAFKRVIILTVASLILFLVALYAWSAYSEYRVTIQGAEAKSKAYTRALKEHAERALGEADHILLNFIVQAKYHEDITRESSELLTERLELLAAGTPQVGSLILVNRQGVLMAHSLDTPLKRTDVSDRDYFLYHRDHPRNDTPFISRPFKSRINGKWRFTISRVLRNKQGQFAGLVAAAMEMDYFQRFYASLDLGKRGKIVLARRDGVLLLAEPFKESNFSIDFSKSHLLRTHLPRSPKGLFHIPRGKALLESDPRIVAYEALDTFPLIAMANQGTDEIISHWRERTIKQGGLIVLASAALVMLTIMMIRQIKRIERGYAREMEQQHKIAEAAASWQSTFDSVEDPIWVMDMNRRITRCNRASSRIFGKEPDQVVNHLCCEIVHLGVSPLPNCPFGKMVETRHRASMELKIENRCYFITVDPVFSTNGELSGAVHIISDITNMKEAEKERELLEQKLLQAQKMEAIGHLAGGIAHDFNNLLTPIMGYAEIALSDTPRTSPLATKLSGILSAAHRAKALTQQLLSFSRRKASSSDLLDLNEVIISINDILRRTIKESIRIELGLDPAGSFIMGDRTQIEQILINLTVNAQDAIGTNQGRIRLDTCRVLMEGENARLYPGMIPGEYVLLSYSDNGIGIQQEVLEHVFEPFFTTKPAGHGTGLGLATVYGIVKQHNAFIGVTSKAGEGATFNIYFPFSDKAAAVKQALHNESEAKRLGEGTVMLVEDNEMVRTMVHEMLVKIGYSVITAGCPHEALELIERDNPSIELLISDVIMPGMNGPDLYEKLLLKIPDLKVIFISGYPINPAQRGSTVEDAINYLQKPFTTEALMERIQQVI